jgi:glycosyltransferase involved in cell wall biosynthesis
MQISVTVLTKNSAKSLPATLNALKPFDDVIVLDTGSTDETETIASSYPNVSFHYGQFQGFGLTHNTASRLARHNWILSIDSDEVVTQDLITELLQIPLNPQNVYSVLRKNFYRGKEISGCGWGHDWIVRLYNRENTCFSNDFVHEKVLTNGLKVVRLSGSILHTPYETVDQFLYKLQAYTTLFANQNRGKKKSSLSKAIGHGLFSFIRSYIFKRGILLGQEGFEISIYNANCAFYKYLKLAESNRQKST